jgi:hypothetical protein
MEAVSLCLDFISKQYQQYKQAQQYFGAGITGFTLSRCSSISIVFITDALYVIARPAVRAAALRMTRDSLKGQTQHEQTN